MTAMFDAELVNVDEDKEHFAGKVLQVKTDLDAERAAHLQALKGLQGFKETPAQKAERFLLSNARAAVRAAEIQCNNLRKAHELRTKHRKDDVELAKKARAFVQGLTNTVVSRVKSSINAVSADEAAGPAGEAAWESSLTNPKEAALEIAARAEQASRTL